IVNELQGKRLELMKDLMPSVKRVGYLLNPKNPNSPRQGKELEMKARSLGLEPRAFEAFSAETLERALKAALASRVDMLVRSAQGSRARRRGDPVMRGLLAVFLALVVGPACAQTDKVYRIGMLEIESARANHVNMEALLRGLKEAGYTEGRNFVIDYRSAEGR